MTLDAFEFIRRFLLHVLPDRFVKSDIMVFWVIEIAKPC
ncbi:hypothetical protein DMNBHIDG_02609 [Candidatus Methanoperedenaceae archaeon GB37]|nr:hypothetical protein DMNBHIDG_02609 [Candidatus Methanoperedenaceae archaeon GB37]